MLAAGGQAWVGNPRNQVPVQWVPSGRGDQSCRWGDGTHHGDSDSLLGSMKLGRTSHKDGQKLPERTGLKD